MALYYGQFWLYFCYFTEVKKQTNKKKTKAFRFKISVSPLHIFVTIFYVFISALQGPSLLAVLMSK